MMTNISNSLKNKQFKKEIISEIALQRLQWQLSEHGIFCAKAFLQADAALNNDMTSGSIR